MKTKELTRYICEICGGTYETAQAALLCETRPVSQDKGVKVGDIVLVTAGEGAGIKAKVTRVSVCSRLYSHYAWERYWHTVAVTADLVDHFGSRFLMFDNYERESVTVA